MLDKKTPKEPASQGGLFIRLSILGLLIIAAPLLSHLHWTIDLLSHLQLQASFGLLILLTFSLLFRKWKSCMIITLIFALSLYQLLPLVKSDNNPTLNPSSQSLSITTFNVLTSNENKEGIASYLKKTASEIIVLCEVNQAWAEHLTTTLKTDYPHRLSDPREDNFGIAIFSKFPLSKKQKHYHSEHEIPLLEVTANTPIGILRVFGAHSTPPMGATGSKSRNDYLEAVAKRAKASSIPVIVAGDLNVTRWSSVYTNLVETGNLLDLADGQGIHPTWTPYKLSLLGLPIDHILASPSIMTLSYQVGPNLGSDHRPVTAVLGLTK